jgi:CxxC motif-containing protein
MDKRTVSSAHARIDGLEKEVVAIKTEMDIQFKDLFNRVKRLEAIMIGTSGFIIVLLLRMNMLG